MENNIKKTDKQKTDKKQILLIVDLQTEFKDKDGKFEEILDFVTNAQGYDCKIATWCINTVESPLFKYGAWKEHLGYPMPMLFKADKVIAKETYGLLDYSKLDKNSHYDIVGFNTDACVFKIAADMFDLGYDISVLTDYCYSSNGKADHEMGVTILKRMFGSAVK